MLYGKGNNALRFTYSYQNEPRTYDGGLSPTVDNLKDGDVYALLGTEVFTEGTPLILPYRIELNAVLSTA